CGVTCLSGLVFVSAPPAQYLCRDSPGPHWTPGLAVPRCGRSLPSDYTVHLDLNLSYQGSSRAHACLEEMERAVADLVLLKVQQTCLRGLILGNIRISPVTDIFTSDTPFAK
ncbi:hypothetical protein EGW08_019066, partial [Elysia chlorotica]